MKSLFSSIEKKIQIAISGILLCVFLVFHLINNLVLFTGKTNFNNMVEFLDSIKPIVRIMEIGFLFILLLHTINAIRLTLINKQKRPTNYLVNAQSTTSTLNSRTMAITGSIILLFLFIHLGYIWYTYQTMMGHDYFSVLLSKDIGFLGHFPTALFYIISIIIIGFHLYHGFQSSLKSFGILKKSKLGFLYSLSVVFWGIIPAGFIMIIISIQLGIIK